MLQYFKSMYTHLNIQINRKVRMSFTLNMINIFVESYLFPQNLL